MTFPTTTQRGWLLLDIDGVLNPRKKPKRPPGYQTWRGRSPNYRNGRHDLTVWYNPDHGPLLLALAEELGLQLAWATQGWSTREANEKFGPWIGLPELPAVYFPRDNFSFYTWKFPYVSQFIDEHGGLPFAWLDDDFHATKPGLAALFRQDYPSSALIDVDEHHGLQPEHLDAVRTWAADLPGSRT